MGYFQCVERGQRKIVAAARASDLYERLMRLPRPDGMSNNEWAKRAGVNTSFFTNIKNGSEPSVGNLRSVLTAVGMSLPEFFLAEAGGKLMHRPSSDRLGSAILESLPGLPKSREKRAAYLAEVVIGVLELPVPPEATSDDSGLPAADGEARAVRVATK